MNTVFSDPFRASPTTIMTVSVKTTICFIDEHKEFPQIFVRFLGHVRLFDVRGDSRPKNLRANISSWAKIFKVK